MPISLACFFNILCLKLWKLLYNYRDIGFVIAKSASVVLHIVSSYGHWREDDESIDCERHQGSSTNVLPVRVSSDTLLRRPSPQNSFRQSARSIDSLGDPLSASTNNSRRRVNTESKIDYRERKWRRDQLDEVETTASSSAIKVTLSPIDEINTTASGPKKVAVVHGVSVLEAARLHKNAEQAVQEALRRDHFRADVKYMSDHYVICSGHLSESLALVQLLRSYHQHEHDAQSQNLVIKPSSTSSKERQLSVLTSHRCFVLLRETLPDAESLMEFLTDEDDIKGRNVLQNVYFVAGSASKAKALARAGAPRARHVIALPVEEQTLSFSNASRSLPAGSTTTTMSEPTNQNDESSLADFGVISSMLAIEMARQQHQQLGNLRRSPVSPRRRLASRTLSFDFASSAGGGEATAPSYQREVDQGLPIESVKLRMLERFPNLDPTVFREKGEVIEARLHQYDMKQSQAADQQPPVDTIAMFQAENTIGILQHTNNARFCRPRDHEVCHDEYPCLAPSFASGNIFLSSVLDRIVCQRFYNPYITDVVESLALGSSASYPGGSNGNSFRSLEDARHQQHHRLFRIRVDEQFVGGKFLDVFMELLRLDMLVIGILRYPDPILENLLPYVYTCSDPETVLHANDKLFILG